MDSIKSRERSPLYIVFSFLFTYVIDTLDLKKQMFKFKIFRITVQDRCIK
jgi:hypothetical protein